MTTLSGSTGEAEPRDAAADVVVCDRCLDLADWQYAHTAQWAFPRRWAGPVAVSDRLHLLPPAGLHAVALCPGCAAGRQRFGGVTAASVAIVTFLVLWDRVPGNGWPWLGGTALLLIACGAVVGPLVARVGRAVEDAAMRATGASRVRRYMVTNQLSTWPVLDAGTVRRDDRPRYHGRLVSDAWLAQATRRLPDRT